MALLEVTNLTKRFGGLTAVNQVSFSLEKGDIVGLIGPNGAGKTTTFSCITGLYRLDQGSVLFEGKNISKWSTEAICKIGIATTFQIVRFFKGMTVLENTMVGCLLRSRSVKIAHGKALDLLKFTGLFDKKDMNSANLTIADKKRLEITRALATAPSLLVLDEVMAGLSVTETQEALNLVKKIHEQGITIFLVEHVMEVVMSLSHRVLVLDSGCKIFEGKPEEVIKNPKVIQVYLGEKYHARSETH
jgi:branched-chain amino acid transport system ATP-binding protein